MARNLLRAGYDVVVNNRSRNKADILANEGASVAESPAQAAGQEIVVTMLSEDHTVEAVVLGAHGVIEGMRPGSLHISMTTISPDLSRRLALAHKERGQLFVAAPVMGGPPDAAIARMVILVAGSKDALAKARPVLQVLGHRVVEVGEHPEDASFLKFFGNFLIYHVLQGLDDVFTAAGKAGIDPKMVFDVLSDTLFEAPAFNTYEGTIGLRKILEGTPIVALFPSMGLGAANPACQVR
jgi:hypothetical protein